MNSPNLIFKLLFRKSNVNYFLDNSEIKMVIYNYHIFKIKIYFFLVRVLQAKGVR